MIFEEKTIKKETIYEGKILNLRRDVVQAAGGQATREVIEHNGAVAMVAMTAENKVILVKQYRYPVGKITLEVPAGKLDAPDEDPLVCAERELSEETGYTADKMEKLTTIATTVGFSNEYIHLYLATGLHSGKQHTDADEFINVVKVPLKEAVAMVNDGRIIDAKSVVSILMAASRQA